MSKYGEAAVLAVEMLTRGAFENPGDAWNAATKKMFPASASLQDKGCPKGAFLGLCGRGVIEGVRPGTNAKVSRNGEYAILAVEVLMTNKFLVSQPDLLWKKVAGNTKTQNHQMDVVIGLWNAGLILAEHS